MTYIEPAQLAISTASENLNPMIEEDGTRVPNWPDPHNWAFNKIVDDSFDIIGKESIKDEFGNLLENVFEDVNAVDAGLERRARQIIEAGLDRGPTDRLMMLTKDNIVIYTSGASGLIFLVSDNKSAVDKEINSFDGKISNFSSVASDFGVDVDLRTGEEFAKSMSNRLDSDVESRDDFDNQLEKDVYGDISNNITRSMDANITLKFGEDDPEVFEYDILLHATPSKRIVIEVKDESHEDADLGKTKLIDRPRDKTNIIGSDERNQHSPFRNNEQTESFVVVNDMDSNKLEQHR